MNFVFLFPLFSQKNYGPIGPSNEKAVWYYTEAVNSFASFNFNKGIFERFLGVLRNLWKNVFGRLNRSDNIDIQWILGKGRL